MWSNSKRLREKEYIMTIAKKNVKAKAKAKSPAKVGGSIPVPSTVPSTVPKAAAGAIVTTAGKKVITSVIAHPTESEQVRKWKARNAAQKAKKTTTGTCQLWKHNIPARPKAPFSLTRTEQLIDGQTFLTVSRPGYPLTKVPQEQVAAWIVAAQQRGIKSIICFLDQTQLNHYNKDLLESYRDAGFTVYSYPVADMENPPIPEDVLEIMAKDVKTMIGPVAIHCSAGLDRSGAALSYLRDPDNYIKNNSKANWGNYINTGQWSGYDEWELGGTGANKGVSSAKKFLTDKQRIAQLEADLHEMDCDVYTLQEEVNTLTTKLAGLTALITQGFVVPSAIPKKPDTIETATDEII